MGEPYLGDYFDLQALGTDFFGTFSASNDLNDAYFPNGVTFERDVDYFTNGGPFRLLDLSGNQVNFSIDPYFFNVTATATMPMPEPDTFALIAGSLLGLIGFHWRLR